MPNGYGYVTDLNEYISCIDQSTHYEPKYIILDLPNGTCVTATLAVFDRNQFRLFLPRHDDKVHVFLIMPSGICYRGYFK